MRYVGFVGIYVYCLGALCFHVVGCRLLEERERERETGLSDSGALNYLLLSAGFRV